MAQATGAIDRFHPGSDPYVPPPQEGAEPHCPECYVIGTGGIVKGVLRGLAEKLGFLKLRRESVWVLKPFQRGVEIEKMLGQNLPQNFPVIDKFENGLATSIKSIDLSAKEALNNSILTGWR